MTLSITIVEDDEHLANLIKIMLSNNFDTKINIISNGWQALDQLASHKPDLLILDIMLPGLNGYEICRKIRAIHSTLPIIMVTAKSEEHDKLEGFDRGADDYITKPFNQAEFIARIKALMRRSYNKISDQQTGVFHVADLTLDSECRTLSKQGQPIDLTAKEFDLVQYFMRFPGRSFSRQHLLSQVWGDQFDGLEHTVNSTINRIRTKLESNINKPEYILTAWGVGYKFRDK